MTEMQIHIENKTFWPLTHRSCPLISDFELTLNRGEFVCLVGPSGCGKTTLLNMIAGLDNDFQGNILLGERSITPNIAYVFQNPRLLPWRTVKENIELVLRNEQSSDIIDELLAAMDLTEAADTYPERLSLGMSRRAAIIRAFAINPDILLMDEPFVSLDPPTARQVRSLLIKLWQQRLHTVLFVTHDLREAIALADRLVFLSKPPMRIISEIQVAIGREQRGNDTLIESFRQDLINHYPKIKALL